MSESARHRPAPSPLVALVVLILLVWLALSLPLVLGQKTLYFRDIFHSHFPFKAFGAQELAEGRIPAFNPSWALGQAFRGNPNTAAFYPSNLLYLVLPFWSAFNLHYCLHWLLAGIAMYALARGLALGRHAALLAALAYAGSGWMLSVMTFYNILTVVAWWPLAMLGVVRGSSRGVALAAIAMGMALLGGEPVTAGLGLVPALALAVRSHGLRRGLLTVAAAGCGAVLVALPQLVATSRVVGFSFRGAHGILASQANYYSLELKRLLELFLPFPFGTPGSYGPSGLSETAALDHLPFYYSLYPGLIAALLAAAACRKRPLLATTAGLGLFLAWFGGLSSEGLLAISGGFFRSPEKLLFWPALAIPLLAGFGLESALEEKERRGSSLLLVLAAGLVVATVVLGVVGGEALLSLIGGEGRSVAGVGAELEASWLRALLVGGLLLIGAAFALRRRSASALVALEIVALLQLAPLWMTDEVAPFRDPPWLERVEAGTAVVPARMAYPPWRLGGVNPTFPPGPHAPHDRFQALELAPAPGVQHGLRYPLAPDLEGMHHLFYNLLTVRIADASWQERARWFQVLGVGIVVSPEPVDSASLELEGSLSAYEAQSFLYRVLQPAPAVWWPDTVTAASSPADAFARVASSAPGSLPGVIPQPLDHTPGGRVELLVSEPDRIELEVDSAGGLVVVQRSFQPLFRARIDSTAIPTLPANLSLLGVVVPQGRHRVVIEAGWAPEGIAGAVAIIALISLTLLATRKDPSQRK